ncbi:MAG TPA: hypothetical protein VJ441_03695 [Dehalococcoidia bacterium]|nr:hypothetical protein [Dehalococcoidia bacterium]
MGSHQIREVFPACCPLQQLLFVLHTQQEGDIELLVIGVVASLWARNGICPKISNNYPAFLFMGPAGWWGCGSDAIFVFTSFAEGWKQGQANLFPSLGEFTEVRLPSCQGKRRITLVDEGT